MPHPRLRRFILTRITETLLNIHDNFMTAARGVHYPLLVSPGEEGKTCVCLASNVCVGFRGVFDAQSQVLPRRHETRSSFVMIDENVQLAAAGDAAAFEKLYRRYHGRVYSLCFRMTHSASDAEDLTQNVFIQLFRKLKTFRGASSFTTWLHRLTVNEVLMHFRRNTVRKERTTEDGTTPTQIVHGTQNHARMSVVDRIALDEAIAQLSPGYRAVLILHDVEGYEHEEIGKILGCAVGTSKSQLHKARMKLRRLLKEKNSPRKVRVATAELACVMGG